jgi:hypothetical protein
MKSRNMEIGGISRKYTYSIEEIIGRRQDCKRTGCD